MFGYIIEVQGNILIMSTMNDNIINEVAIYIVYYFHVI